MDIVFMFKNQSGFRGDNVTDLKMLKISIKQWKRFYKPGLDNIYISGSYNKQELDELLNYLGNSFMDNYNIKIINVGDIPKEFNNNKTNRINYQLIMTWLELKSEFIVGTNDIFPIRFIDDTYLNKLYKILYNDYTKIPSKDMFWLMENWVRTIEYFKYKYNFENKIVYEGHNPYLVTKEFMDFYLADNNLWFNMDRDIVLFMWLLMNGEDIFTKEQYCKETFYANKLQITKKDLKRLKMINVTLPNHPESKKILKRIIK